MTSSNQAIVEALGEARISLGVGAIQSLSQHLDMVVAASATMNLTSVTAPQHAAWIHVVDALLGISAISRAPNGPLCDLGSGAGYPGIPLGIASGRHATLVESTGKKAAFLRTVIKTLSLDGDVLAQRAETVGGERGGQYAVVTARALSALPSVLELAAPLLVPGGRIVAYKGTPDDEEIARGDTVADLLGLRRLEAEHHTLKGVDDARRTLIVYELVRGPRVALPRRNGLAQHSPLA